MSGLDVLSACARATTHVPVLILTAADTVEQRVRGLDLGADDFMAKPFALSELEARVRALVRRRMGRRSTRSALGAAVFRPGRPHGATSTTSRWSCRRARLGLLEILMQRSGRLVSKEQIVDHLCEWGDEVSPNAIEVYVHRLRKKIEGGGIRIATVRGLGYCLERPATRALPIDARRWSRAA